MNIYVVLSGRNPRNSAFHMAAGIVHAETKDEALTKANVEFEKYGAIPENNEPWEWGPVVLDWTVYGLAHAQQRVNEALETFEI